jgi:hypothetical protein
MTTSPPSCVEWNATNKHLLVQHMDLQNEVTRLEELTKSAPAYSTQTLFRELRTFVTAHWLRWL